MYYCAYASEVSDYSCLSFVLFLNIQAPDAMQPYHFALIEEGGRWKVHSSKRDARLLPGRFT